MSVTLPVTPTPAAHQAWLQQLREAVQPLRRDRALRPRERKLAAALGKAFRAQGKAFMARLDARRHKIETTESKTLDLSGGPTPVVFREAIEEFGWEKDFAAAALASLQAFEAPLSMLVTEMLDIGIRQVIADFAIGVSFNVKHPLAVEYIKAHSAELVAGIDVTTKAQLRTLIGKAVDEGWSYSRLAKGIRGKFADYAGPRATKIAVHEMGMAYEQGSLMGANAMADEGLTMEKSWLTVGDLRVEDTCANNEGQGWIPLGDSFGSGDDAPLAHLGCRCTMLTRRAGSA